jgi:Protein of unknown function (DUF2950)
MNLRQRNWVSTSFFVVLSLIAESAIRAQDSGVKSFPTYGAATGALIAAMTANDTDALKEILGTPAMDLLSSGDAAQDDQARQSFLKHYREKHTFVRESSDKVVLQVGTTAWALPFPIERANGEWHFDAVEGAQELAYRRIGHNELDAIKVCRALAAAQKTYAAGGHDGDSPGVYAQRIFSQAGTQNGLYWEVQEGEAPSPAGILVAEATSEGVPSNGKRTPFHGYYFRTLKSQGAHAKGGAKEYVKDGKMTGGFAFVAYPAEYGASGVMTFMVAKDGAVYQKDLGQATEQAARDMTAFDPDDTWKRVG